MPLCTLTNKDLISDKPVEVVAMADFMEQEAVESDSDGSEDLARKKRPVSACLFVYLLVCCFFLLVRGSKNI